MTFVVVCTLLNSGVFRGRVVINITVMFWAVVPVLCVLDTSYTIYAVVHRYITYSTYAFFLPSHIFFYLLFLPNGHRPHLL